VVQGLEIEGEARAQRERFVAGRLHWFGLEIGRQLEHHAPPFDRCAAQRVERPVRSGEHIVVDREPRRPAPRLGNLIARRDDRMTAERIGAGASARHTPWHHLGSATAPRRPAGVPGRTRGRVGGVVSVGRGGARGGARGAVRGSGRSGVAGNRVRLGRDVEIEFRLPAVDPTLPDLLGALVDAAAVRTRDRHPHDPTGPPAHMFDRIVGTVGDAATQVQGGPPSEQAGESWWRSGDRRLVRMPHR
jgi:hypothetical protein